MASTVYGVNDAKAVKRWSAATFADAARMGYWSNKFAAKGRQAMAPIQVLTELESDAGDEIKFDLFLQLRNKPVYGDDRLEGKEEAMRTKSDSVKIDQIRDGVSAGGRMTRKRTLHDIRARARELMGDWWARLDDEHNFSYVAGSRGIDPEFIEDIGWTGYAGNALQAPDAGHLVYGGAATSKVSMVATDKVDLGLIDKIATKAKTMGGGVSGKTRIRPINIDGEKRFVFVMHTFQEYDLRRNTNTLQWADLQKALITSVGAKAPIYRGGLGIYNDIVLHSHESVIRFNDYGAGTVAAARAVLLGRQAMVQAYGSPGDGLRMAWHEETADHGNEILISASVIKGVKKTQFETQDFGVISVDAAAADPNPA